MSVEGGLFMKPIIPLQVLRHLEAGSFLHDKAYIRFIQTACGHQDETARELL